MIGGFVVEGTGAKRVILRSIGPELTPLGVPNVLANPTLELHNESGALIGSNNDWQTTIIGGVITTNQVTDIQNSGHAPTAASEPAMIATLQPGKYTVHVWHPDMAHEPPSQNVTVSESERLDLTFSVTAAPAALTSAPLNKLEDKFKKYGNGRP